MGTPLKILKIGLRHGLSWTKLSLESKFQAPILNGDVCRAATDKQTHKHTHKHTYRVKTEETFFHGHIFYFLFLTACVAAWIMPSFMTLRHTSNG